MSALLILCLLYSNIEFKERSNSVQDIFNTHKMTCLPRPIYGTDNAEKHDLKQDQQNLKNDLDLIVASKQ